MPMIQVSHNQKIEAVLSLVVMICNIYIYIYITGSRSVADRIDNDAESQHMPCPKLNLLDRCCPLCLITALVLLGWNEKAHICEHKVILAEFGRLELQKGGLHRHQRRGR